MKSVKHLLSVCLLTAIIFGQASAQNKGEFFDILYSAPKDANTFLNSYLSPITKGLGYGMTTGWYTTAKPHNTLGFDISVSMSTVFVPKSDQTFTFQNSDYTNLELANGTQAEIPTVIGPNENTPALRMVDHNATFGDVTLANFNAPSGLGFKKKIGFAAIPVPILSFGIGLVKNTDLKFRFIPDVANNVKYSFWGIGLMHDITQWIPVVDKLPIDISILAAYSNFKFDYPMTESESGWTGSNQDLNGRTNGLTIEALVSKKISVLTLLVGLGYDHSSTKFNIDGNYDIDYSDLSSTWPAGYSIPGSTNNVVTYTDPIALTGKNGGVKLTGGLRLQFAVITLDFNYTLGSYNVLNTGLGVTFR
jgi:hypothetical protein